MRQWRFIFPLSVFACLTVCFQAPMAAGGASVGERLAGVVDAYEKTNRGRAGVAVVDLATGETVYRNARADEPMIPASNQKLLTTIFALEQLGDNYQFVTNVFHYDGKLIVVGGWDPLLGDPVLAKKYCKSIYDEPDRWARQVREKIGNFNGEVLVFSRLKPSEFYPPGWSAKLRCRWYGAPVASLNFHDNCFDVTFVENNENTEKKSVIVPIVSPQAASIKVINETRKAGRHLWRLVSNDDDSVVRIIGMVKSASRDPLSSPVSNPPMLLGRIFADRLARVGAEVSGVGVRYSGPTPPDTAKLLACTKTPIAAVITRANKRSLNLAAECLLLAGGDGSWSGSCEAMRRMLSRTFNLDASRLVICDGSGLSRGNRVSPRNLARLLEGVVKRPYGPVLLKSLPLSGVDGTLRKRLTGPLRGRIAAKTGYISGAVALSGFVLDADARPRYAFSILINNVRGVAQARRIQNDICTLLVEATNQTPPENEK